MRSSLISSMTLRTRSPRWAVAPIVALGILVTTGVTVSGQGFSSRPEKADAPPKPEAVPKVSVEAKPAPSAEVVVKAEPVTESSAVLEEKPAVAVQTEGDTVEELAQIERALMPDGGGEEFVFPEERGAAGPDGSLVGNALLEPMPGSGGSFFEGKKLLLRLDLAVDYDDNIFLNEVNPQSDFLFRAAPGIRLQLGDHELKEYSYFLLDYAPMFIAFSDNSDENAVDHDATLAGQWGLRKLSLLFEARYLKTSEGNREVGDRVNAQIFRAFAALRYKWNEKLKFGTGLEFFHRDYEDQLDSRELINENFVDYGITPKTDLGLGVTLGRLDVDASTGDQTYEQFLLRLTTRTTAKFKLLARAGVELRQYSPSGSESTPVFGLGAEYKPWDGTELGLELYRDVNPSISTPGENIIATGIRLRARQRVFRRWRLGLTAGYENSDFTVADAVSAETFDTRADANRDDDYFFIRPAIAYEFKKGIRGEIFYLYRKNTSSLQGSAFTNNQVGARVSLEY